MPASDYVLRLRAKIGHELIMLQAVTIMIFDDARRLLLALDRNSGLWMTIGGAIEPDETPADAAVRECWEETRLTIRPIKLLGVLGGPKYRITYSTEMLFLIPQRCSRLRLSRAWRKPMVRKP
jgi:8-oxo-dGTP pyrophosphatase MutT (NUDIX family)